MSRSGYSYNLDNWALICWRGAVASAIRGKRGQAFLGEMKEVLDAMPTKELISGELVQDDEVCALGAVGIARGLDMAPIDPEEYDQVAALFGVSEKLVREIESVNDEDGRFSIETPIQRWIRVRRWVDSQIKKAALQSEITHD